MKIEQIADNMDYIAIFGFPMPPAIRDQHDKITSRWPLPENGSRFLTPKALIDILETNPLTSDLYPLAMGFYPKAAGHRMKRKSHNSHLLIYCTGGKGYLKIDTNSFTVGAGDVILLPPGVAHAYSADTENPWSILWVHYTGFMSGEYTDFLSGGQVHRSIGLRPHIMEEFEALLELRRKDLSVTRYIQSASRLKSLLTEFGCALTPPQTGREKTIDMDELLEHMRHNVAGGLDLDSLSAIANLSKFHFIRRFKESTGHTPIEQFIYMKMEKACTLLDTKDNSIKYIAAELGYKDPLYFSRQFRKIIGVSPTQYRKLHST